MAQYPGLSQLVTSLAKGSTQQAFLQLVLPYLQHIWLTSYEKHTGGSDIVVTTDFGFSYLFDISTERLIAAWGFSTGRNAAPRPDSRMQGYPAMDRTTIRVTPSHTGSGARPISTCSPSWHRSIGVSSASWKR